MQEQAELDAALAEAPRGKAKTIMKRMTWLNDYSAGADPNWPPCTEVRVVTKATFRGLLCNSSQDGFGPVDCALPLQSPLGVRIIAVVKQSKAEYAKRNRKEQKTSNRADRRAK